MPQYRVLPGKNFGLHRGGEIVEHEAKDAAPYIGTHLEPVTDAAPKGGAAAQHGAKAPPGGSQGEPAFGPARFADMNVEDTIQAAKQLTDAQRKELLAWERANKKRVTVISALEAE
jgi:hypothetical protein